MGDIGPERAHYDVLPTAEDLPAVPVEVSVDATRMDEERTDVDVLPGR